MMKYTFIVNPNSRSGMGGMIWETIEPELIKRQVEYECLRTDYPGHAMKLVRELTADREEHILAVLGGDGTVNEVINGICDISKVTLGYIPTGSSNDFARGMKLPKDPLKALEVILNPGEIKKMDVGLLTRAGKERRFAVSTGIGFDAAICHQAAVSKLKVLLNRLKLGKLTYVGIALNRLFHDKPVKAEVTLDDGVTKQYKKVYFIAAMNNPYEGGGFYFCPDARSSDRQLDVIIISNLPKLAVLLLLPTAYKGWHVHFPGISVMQCKKVCVKMERALPVHTDGEPVFLRKEIKAELLKEQIRVISA